MIKTLRIQLGLTTDDAARLFGVSRRTWQRWELHEERLTVDQRNRIISILEGGSTLGEKKITGIKKSIVQMVQFSVSIQRIIDQTSREDWAMVLETCEDLDKALSKHLRHVSRLRTIAAQRYLEKYFADISSTDVMKVVDERGYKLAAAELEVPLFLTKAFSSEAKFLSQGDWMSAH